MEMSMLCNLKWECREEISEANTLHGELMLIHTLFCCPFCASSPFTGLETSRNSYISLTFLVFSPFQAPGCADSHTMAGPHYLGVPRQPSSPREKGISATEEPCLEAWSAESVSSPRPATWASWAWQEESHLNRHFLTHKPSKLLSPESIWDDSKPKPPEIHFAHFSTVDKDYK